MAKFRKTPVAAAAATFFFIGIFLMAAASCSDAIGPESEEKKAGKRIVFKEITGYDQLKTVVMENSHRLLVLDFYADWCRPCTQLEPILKELAHSFGNRAAIFKINIDKNQNIASDLGIGSIPYVLLVREGKAVEAIMGLYPKRNYVRLFQKHAPSEAALAGGGFHPDGEIVDGVRVIRKEANQPLKTLRVYRGDTVRLIMNAENRNYGISIPAFGIKKESEAGGPLKVRFKAKDEGEFSVFCSGDCPETGGDEFGRIVVTAYKGSAASRYRELSSQQAREFILSENPLVLDVRTQGEFNSGHIKGAKRIPVQELASRVSELQAHKDKEIFIYCRSGNRSTVAAEILTEAGFRKLSNLRYGIIEWEQKGFPVEKPGRTASK